jgi:hypothetical protein
MLTRNAHRLPVGLLVLGLASACPGPATEDKHDSGTAPDAATCKPKTCGSACGSLADGCGATLSCGGCPTGEVCNANVCECQPESTTALCTRLGKNCGDVLGRDNCGASRTVPCGSCSGSESCGGTGTPNVCGNGVCTKTTCAAQGKDCGAISNNCDGVLQCGTCTAPKTCGSTNVCACTAETGPAFCSRLGKDCGTVSAQDNCGQLRSEDCGTCTPPLTCGGGGANLCGVGTGIDAGVGLDAGLLPDGGGDEVTVFEYLGATPAQVTFGGTSTVSFRAMNSQGQLVGQLPVLFVLYQDPGGCSVSPGSTATTADGIASTTLTAGNTPGTARVQISTTSGSVANISDAIVIAGKPISAKNLTVDCQHGSIAGFEQDGLEMTCTVHGSDADGAYVPGSKAFLMTEAGGVPASVDFVLDAINGGGIATFTYRTQCQWPKDVPPLGTSEPGHACSFLNHCLAPPAMESRTCNPRDGLATLVAITTGWESFADTNGNGRWDTGEPYQDQGEPFVDANDNGAYETGEDFYDTNNNGVRNGPNGKWDDSYSVWTSYKVLWTGVPDFTSTNPQASITPADGVILNHCVAQSYVLRIFDINGNPPTASGSGDAVSVLAAGNVVIQQVGSYYDGVTTPPGSEKQGVVLVDVQDAHPCACAPSCPPPQTYTLGFLLDRTLDGNGTSEPQPDLGTRTGTYQ